jgi:hypothetical protein
MLLIQHIGWTAATAYVLALVILWTGEGTLTTTFVLSAMGAQLIDLDHYNGSMTMLVRCGLISSCSDPMLKTCDEQLQRGIFHFVPLYIGGVLVLLLGALFTLRHRNRHIPYILLGLALGWSLHLFLDDIILPHLFGLQNSLI